jgi:TetR/AcrR family transcriptional regulator
VASIQEKRKPKAAPDRPSVRERLLDATAAVMTAQDTVDVSLADISTEANVNIALISYYFGSKEELMLALAKRDATKAMTEMEVLMGLPIGPADKLRRHLAGIIRTYFRHPYLNRLLRALMRDSSTRIARQIAEFFAASVAGTMAQLITAGVAAGELRPIDPMLFYFAAIGACENLFSGRTTLKFVFDNQPLDEALCTRHIETVTDLLMAGCLLPEHRLTQTSTHGRAQANDR